MGLPCYHEVACIKLMTPSLQCEMVQIPKTVATAPFRTSVNYFILQGDYTERGIFMNFKKTFVFEKKKELFK